MEFASAPCSACPRVPPTDDGGESFRMKGVFCKEAGSIMSKFIHTDYNLCEQSEMGA
jgi:hypothetical protein